MRERAPVDADEDLLRRMTLPEKLGQLAMLTGDGAVTGPGLAPDALAAVRDGRAGSLLNVWGADRLRHLQRLAVEETRLGIPLVFGLDVLHGHRTIFPIPLAEAGSFDPELWSRTARCAAAEAAADGLHLTFAPMLDVARDPRWGRMAESPGEDPVLAAAFATAKVAAFQRGGPAAPGSLAATAKHFAAYGAVAAGREYASADLSERSLHEVHLPAFRAAVAAGAAAIMPALTDLAGLPMTAHAGLLRELLRGAWGFDGVVISDYGAVAQLVAHGVAADLGEAAALALRAGTDIDMMGGAYAAGLPVALERGLVSAAEIDEAVRRVLRWKRRLGLFEDPFRAGAAPPAPDIPLARDAARRSMVLLKNDGALLPLAPGLRRIALLGPLADAAAEMLGPWSAAGDPAGAVSYLAGLRAALPDARILHAQGCSIAGAPAAGAIAAAAALAAGADLAILCLGEAAAMAGEAASRGDPGLPGAQAALADAVLATGVPTVLVLTCGRPLIAPDLLRRVPAALAAWFPGQEAGHALADLLSGRAAPSARLPVSWPADRGQIPVFHSERPTGRPPQAGGEARYVSRYLDLPREPIFPFGHGLSYTRFRYLGLSAGPDPLPPGQALEVEVELANEGARAGEEVVLLFLHDPVASTARPLLELRAFARLSLAAGARGRVRFRLPPASFEMLDLKLRPVREPGRVEILAGPRAERAALLAAAVELLPG